VNSAGAVAVVREHPVYASLRQESRFWVELIRVDEPETVRNRLHLVLDARRPHTGGSEGRPAIVICCRGALLPCGTSHLLRENCASG